MNVLAIGAHFDDLELGCGGALARHCQNGDKVIGFVATDSGFSNLEGIQLRKNETALQEAETASRVIGYDLMLGGIPTFYLEYGEQIHCKLLKLIEENHIEMIYTHWVHDVHHDHRNLALATLHARMFCYDFPEKYLHNEVRIFYDDNEQMNYVLHDGKRMYLSGKFPNERAMKQYYNSLCMEQDMQSPHLYQSDRVHVKEGDVLLDVGAAEGFFALSVIDKISYAYLIEADSDWEKALKATFRPYKDKVRIISGFVSDVVGENEITIDSIIKDQRLDFLKMDIEGAEKKALAGAVNTLKTHCVRCAVCTYHNDDDFTEIADFFSNMQYLYEVADGYLLCGGMWEKDNRTIDFRRGVLRSWKNDL